MSKPDTGVLVRWVAAALVAVFGLLQLGHVLATDLSWGTLGNTLTGVGALFVAVALVGPELVGWALVPLHGLVDRLLMPSESEPPPAAFKLARYYASLLRHEEACDEYAKIIRYHPEETDAYLEGIREAFLAGDPAQAKKFYQKGRRVMRTRGERSLLRGVYTARHEAPGLPEEAEPMAADLPAGEAVE